MINILSNTLNRTLLACVLATAALTPAHAETAVPVEDFSVFVDIPTGFAFVKTPAGWRFVRQIEASRLGELHPTTLVSVIQAGERLGKVQDPKSAPVL
jgi:predicted anti-sigma-YlaC factor YlaD